MRRRTETPSSKIRLSPGDVFAVPLGNGAYAFGRLAPQKGCAVFAGVTFTELRLPDQWRSLPMIILEYLIVTEPIEAGRWPIIGSLPWRMGEFTWQHYMVGSQVTSGEGAPDHFTDASSQTRAPEPGEWNRRPKLGIWNEEGVVHALRKNLGVA
jgi:hypothetical protein